MAKKSTNPPTFDITKVGPRRFNELQQQNMQMQGIDLYSRHPEFAPTYEATAGNPNANRPIQAFSPLYREGKSYWGSSRYDPEGALDIWDVERLSDIRAKNQPNYVKVFNGAVKMGTTALTTFLDDTIGALYGVGKGVSNWFDGDASTGFWQGMWDNEFNRAMADIQEAMEDIAPNYYTEEELTTPWYHNIWTANFLGDKLLKNAGFTIGALATMTVPGVGLVGEGAKAVTTGLGKVVTATNIMKNSSAAARTMKGFQQAGGIAQKLVNSFVMANGESAIESINAVKANEQDFTRNINNWVNNARMEALTLYRKNGDKFEYEANLADIDKAQQAAMLKAGETLSDLGNSVYFGNIALLMITNNLEFGKYIKGGWNVNKGIDAFEKRIGKDVVTKDAAEFGRALAKGTGTLEVPKEVGQRSFKEIALGTASRFAEEAFEEGAQRIISDSGQMRGQAKVNRWAKENYGDGDLLGASINPDVTDEVVDFWKSIGEAWKQGFGSIASPGWEEVFLGGLTGAMGTISVGKSPITGKWNGWQGGFIEEWRRPTEEQARMEKIASAFNEYVQDPKFLERTKHAITSITLAEIMEDAVQNDDILAFKNAEMMSVAADALFFMNQGAINAYRGFYEEMANNVSDEDIVAVKSQMRDLTTGKSWFDGKDNDKIKEMLKSKAQSTLDKIDDVLATFDKHALLYTDKITKTVGEEVNYKGTNLIGAALEQLTGVAALIDDMNRRKNELEQQREQAKTQAEKDESFGPQIKELEDKIAEKNSQYDKYIKHPEELISDLKNIIDLAEERAINKDTERAKERLKTAKTLDDVAEFYFNTEEDIRQKVFDKAVRESEGDVKELLKSFRPFLGTLQALDNLIDQKAKQYGQVFEDRARQYEVEGDISQHEINDLYEEADRETQAYREIFKQLVHNTVEEFVKNPDLSYSKRTLELALKDKANELLSGELDQTSAILAMGLNDLANSVKTLDDTYREADEMQEAVAEEKKEREKNDAEEKPAQNPFVVGKHIKAEKPEETPPEEEEYIPEDEEDETEEEEYTPSASNTLPNGTPVENAEDVNLRADIQTETEEEPVDEKEAAEPQMYQDPESKEKKEHSFRGKTFTFFQMSPLAKDGTALKVNGVVSKELKKKGIDIDYVVNNLLWDMMQTFPDHKLPVEYMLMRTGKRGDTSGHIFAGKSANHIFLVTRYSPDIEKIAPRTNTQIAGNIIESNGREYFVVGIMGFGTNDANLQKQHAKLSDMLGAEARERIGEEFVVHNSLEDNISNFIYDMTPGYVIRKEGARDTQSRDQDLGDLMSNPSTNPKGLKFGDLRWVIMYGDEGKAYIPSKFAKKEGEYYRYTKNTDYPGKIYVYLKASDGTYIPQAVSPVRFRELSEANGPIWEKVQAVIKQIAEAETPAARESSMGELRKLFVFKPKTEGSGTNIFYNAETNVLDYSVGGTNAGSLDFNEEMSVEDRVARISDMLANTNPRFRINSNTLISDPGYYINNRIIKVNLRSLGTYEAKSYAYPVNDDGTPMVTFDGKQEAQGSKDSRPKSERQVYFNGQKYYIDTEQDGTYHVYDNEHHAITDEAKLHEMQDIMHIITYDIPQTSLEAVSNSSGKLYNYYISSITNSDVDTYVYIKVHEGGYKRLQGRELSIFRSRYAAQQEKSDRLNNVFNELEKPAAQEEISVSAFEEEITPKEEEKPVEKKSSTLLQGVAKNPNFAKLLVENIEAYGMLLEIGKNLGQDWNQSTDINTIEEALRAGKHAEMYLKVTDQDSLYDYIEEISDCGF